MQDAISETRKAIRDAFDGASVPSKNLALRRASDRIAELEEIVLASMLALERAHATTSGGPKKSDALALLNRARKAVPQAPDLYADGVV